jgi:endonuclease-8
MWKAEGLFPARVSPWARLRELGDDEPRTVLAVTSAAMRGPRRCRNVYARAGLPCRRCATPVSAWRRGDEARTAFWCSACQPVPAGATGSR